MCVICDIRHASDGVFPYYQCKPPTSTLGQNNSLGPSGENNSKSWHDLHLLPFLPHRHTAPFWGCGCNYQSPTALAYLDCVVPVYCIRVCFLHVGRGGPYSLLAIMVMEPAQIHVGWIHC